MGKIIEVVRVSECVRGRARSYPYHSVRIVERDEGGGHYLRSRGCRTLFSTGPKRGTKRIARKVDEAVGDLIRCGRAVIDGTEIRL